MTSDAGWSNSLDEWTGPNMSLLAGTIKPAFLTLLLVLGVMVGFSATSENAPATTPITSTPEGAAFVTSNALPAATGNPTSNSGSSSTASAASGGGAAERAVRRATEMVGNMEALISNVGQGASAGGPFHSLGKRLIAVLGATVLIWGILKNMILKNGVTQIVGDLVFPMVVIAMTWAALEHNFAADVRTSVASLGDALAGGSAAGGGSTAQLFLSGMLGAMKDMWAAELPDFEWTEMGFSILVAFLLQLLTLAFMALGAAFGVGVIFVADFQIALAIALAPVMIPWLLFRPAEFLFSGWLSFLLKGCFQLLAVKAVAGVVASSVTALNTIGAGSVAGYDSAITYGAIALMAALFAYLLIQSASIGSGIISGGPAGIGGFGSVARSGAAPVLKGMKGVGSAGKGAVGAGMAFKHGKQHAGQTDRQLSQFQKTQQPQRGSFQRNVYEMGRKAGSDEGGGGKKKVWSD